jgi:hypothetical protein
MSFVNNFATQTVLNPDYKDKNYEQAKKALDELIEFMEAEGMGAHVKIDREACLKSLSEQIELALETKNVL